MTKPLLIGRAEVRPDPRVGDVCRVYRGGQDQGLWVPFAGCGGRSDGDRIDYPTWVFADFEDPEHHRRFSLGEVAAIEIPCEDNRAREFWERAQAFMR